MYLSVIFACQLRIIHKFVRDIQQSDNSVHRSSDIVAHAGKKITPGLICNPQLLILPAHPVDVIAPKNYKCQAYRQYRHHYHCINRISLYKAGEGHIIGMYTAVIQKISLLHICKTINIIVKDSQKLCITFF